MAAEDHVNGYHGEPDAFDVRTSLNNLAEAARNNKLLIALTVVFTMALLVVYLFVFPPVYSANAMVMIERDNDPVRDAFYIGWDVFRKDDGKTEIELMTSTPILQQVVEKEHLQYDDVYHPFMSHLVYVWQESALGKKYKAIKQALMGGEKEVGSPEMRELVRTMFDMRAGIALEVIADTNAGRLTVKAPTPENSARIANRLLEVYLADRAARYQSEAQKSLNILNEEMGQAAVDLREAEQRRTAYQVSHGLMIDFQREQVEVGKLAELQTTIASTEARIAGMEASLRELDKQLAVEPVTKTTSTVYEINALRETAKAKRLELQMSLIGVRDRFAEESPEVKELKNDIAKLDSIIADTSEKVAKGSTEGLNAVRQDLVSKRSVLVTDLEAARATLAAEKQTSGVLRSELTDLPVVQAGMRQFDRDSAMAQEKYTLLTAKRSQAAVSLVTARAAMQSMRVVESAGAPSEKSWPKPKILVPSALALGLALGLGAALFRSYASGRVRREHIERGRGDAPLYGTIAVPSRVVPLAIATIRENGRTKSGVA